jgi:transposase-like protein
VSRSSISRHLVAKTSQEVDRFLSRRLEGQDLPVIMIDGKGFADHMLVTALGIDAGGKKQVLGFTEGTTESEGVCRSLLQGLVDRGLRVERARLFVIDGGKGIRKAIRATFGNWALIQRCQEHKLRNVVEHLPESKREWMRAAMRRAWEADTIEKARGRMKGLAAQLRETHPGAAASILEGMDETLTVIALGMKGSLLRTLRSTNPIENLQGALQRICRNVKRWRSGAMVMRWGATALMEAEKKFRRIAGYKGMGLLMSALEAKVSSVDNQKAAA